MNAFGRDYDYGRVCTEHRFGGDWTCVDLPATGSSCSMVTDKRQVSFHANDCILGTVL